MKSIISIIFYFFGLSLIIAGIGEGAIHYGSLIKNVHDKYRTGAIIIGSTRNYFSLEKVRILHEILYYLSTKGHASTVVNFMQLDETINSRRRTPARPLVAIFINQIDEIDNFKTGIVKIDMNYPLWLILFTGDSDEDGCRYCRDPVGNPLNLEFHSEMLVSCCDAGYIEEWWPKSMNHASKLTRGKWIEEDDRIEWLPNGCHYDGRSFEDKKEFRIVIVKGSSYVWKENDQVHGYLGDLINELSQVMNFSISGVIEEMAYGSWNSESSMWGGAVGAVAQGRADIGVAEFTMTLERISVVDFTLAIATSKYKLYIRKPDNRDIHWDGFVKPLHPKVWMIIIMFISITPLLLTIIKYKREYNFFQLLLEHYLNIWGIFCQQGLPGFPGKVSLRIVYLSIFTSAIVVQAAYSGSLIRSLTFSLQKLPFHTMEEFVRDGTYKLSTLRDSADYDFVMRSNDTVLKEMMKLMVSRDSLPTSRKEALKQVCAEKVAWLINDAAKHITDDSLSCGIISIDVGGANHMGMILPLKSEYTKLFNYYIQQFQYHGLLHELEQKYFGNEFRKSVVAENFQAVTFSDILPILVTWAAGFSIALSIFCIELP